METLLKHELFNKYARSYGQPIYPFPPKASDPESHVIDMPFFEMNQSLTLYEGKKNKNGNVFHGYIGLVDGGVANARADVFEDLYIAVFGMKFCVDLYCHFQSLLSHPGVFSGIGDSAAEDPRVAWVNDESSETALQYFGELKSHEKFGPIAKSAERRMVANRLYHWAIRFVGFHEVAHLALGHVNLLEEITSEEKGIDDNSNEYARNKNNRFRRSLEHQADLHAMQRLAMAAIIDSKRPGAHEDSLSVITFEMFVAILAVMRIWSRGMNKSFGKKIENYPHPIIRFIGLAESVRAQFRALKLNSMDQAAMVKGIGTCMTETALQDVALQCERPAVDWMDNYNKLRTQFYKIVRDSKDRKLRRQLKKYEFVDFYRVKNFPP
jgi:hypothetical protein